MKYTLHTHNIQLSDGDQAHLEKKLNRLEKHVLAPYVLDLVFIHDAHHLHGQVITCRINVEHGKHVMHAERTADTIQNALDQASAALENELQKSNEQERRGRWSIKRWLGR